LIGPSIPGTTNINLRKLIYSKVIKRHQMIELHICVSTCEQVHSKWWQNRKAYDLLIRHAALQPHTKHHIEPQQYLQKHVKEDVIIHSCNPSSEVANRSQQNRPHVSEGDVRANSNPQRPPPRRARSWRELQRRMSSMGKQHSTAVPSCVWRSGLTVIGREFGMDMTLGLARGKLSRG
jgi:hypothetical protein